MWTFGAQHYYNENVPQNVTYALGRFVADRLPESATHTGLPAKTYASMVTAQVFLRPRLQRFAVYPEDYNRNVVSLGGTQTYG